MNNKNIEEIIKERDSKMYGYWKSVFQDGYEGGYPIEWNTEVVNKINSQVQAEKEQLKEFFLHYTELTESEFNVRFEQFKKESV